MGKIRSFCDLLGHCCFCNGFPLNPPLNWATFHWLCDTVSFAQKRVFPGRVSSAFFLFQCLTIGLWKLCRNCATMQNTKRVTRRVESILRCESKASERQKKMANVQIPQAAWTHININHRANALGLLVNPSKTQFGSNIDANSLLQIIVETVQFPSVSTVSQPDNRHVYEKQYLHPVGVTPIGLPCHWVRVVVQTEGQILRVITAYPLWRSPDHSPPSQPSPPPPRSFFQIPKLPKKTLGPLRSGCNPSNLWGSGERKSKDMTLFFLSLLYFWTTGTSKSEFLLICSILS